MNENIKTLTFVVVALLVVAVAWISRPSSLSMQPEEMQDKPLFEKFTNPLAATSLEILKYDEATSTITPFKVAQINDRWSIPSHDSYPADAKDHLAEAATSLMNLTVLGVVSTNPGDHGLYGVVDPGSKSLAPGATGVGTRVTMKDKDNNVLLDLIIGKPDPSGKDRSGLFFVRRANEDPVYSVALKTDKLSTKFEDWIEKDLLKMNTWDILGLKVQDYSIDIMAQAQNQRGQFALAYNDTGDPKWKLAEDRIFQDNKWADGKLANDEELNTAKLDAMRSALGELKIVDVSRKPKGLSGDLKASGSVTADAETSRSLAARGFYFARGRGNDLELLSNEGETRVTMKDGVEYVLRFGQIAGAGGQPDEKKQAEKKEEGKKEGDKPKTDDSPTSGVNRFLFVMAEFNPDAIKKPELQPLPEVPAEAAKPDAKPEGEKKDTAKKEGAKEDKKEPEKKDAQKPDPKAERDRIEKENKRKQDEYNEKIKKGQDRVKELNERFADWYYVISDGVYQKIHLTRADIIKKKEAKDAKAANKPGENVPGSPVDTSQTPAALQELKSAAPAPAETPKASGKPAPEKPKSQATPAKPPVKPAPAANPPAKAGEATATDAKPAPAKAAPAKK